MDSIQHLRNKNVLKKDFTTGTSGQMNRQNLSKSVEKLLDDPSVLDLPANQQKGLAEGLDKLRKRKVINPPNEPTIEQLGDL